MSKPLTISISLAALLRMRFYEQLLVAVGDQATELRFESKSKVFLKVGGIDYEAPPTPREVAEQEILSLTAINDDRDKDCLREVRFLLEIGGKMTEVVASVQPSLLVLYFLNPEAASNEASEMLTNLVCSATPK